MPLESPWTIRVTRGELVQDEVHWFPVFPHLSCDVTTTVQYDQTASSNSQCLHNRQNEIIICPFAPVRACLLAARLSLC